MCISYSITGLSALELRVEVEGIAGRVHITELVDNLTTKVRRAI